MKFIRILIVVALGSTGVAQTASPKTMSTPAAKLPSTLFDWEKMEPTTTANGVRRAVLDGATTTLDKLHIHVTTLNPGQNSGEPRRHLQEEVILVKEGRVEASVDGATQTVGAGSILFFAANAVTRLRNAGDGPATYVVIYYFTPLTPKN